MSGKDDSPIAVGKLRVDVLNLTELTTPVKLPIVYIANMPWSLEVRSERSKRTKDIKHLYVFVNCNEADKSPHWSCEATVIYNLLSPRGSQKSYSRKTAVCTFSAKQSNWGFGSFIAWDKVLDPANGFTREEDGGVVVEATVTITKVIGLTMPTLCDFTAPQPNLTDVALIVEEKPLHINKAYLACHSPVFNSMFFSDFAEKTRKEVFLATVEFLLCLADRFNIQVVLQSCEEFLGGTGSEEIPLAKKLLLSDQYRLTNLQYNCLQTIKTIDEVRMIKRMKEFDDFSSKLNKALLERTLEIG